ncbi:MAG TPA: hypothetical protein VD965_13895 [Burkholderiales bacterium]|nr:hypothetical protein [Burkholderiales bacterium]
MDNDILEVENRIREREVKIRILAKQTGRRTLTALTHPASLAAVAVLGFLAGGGINGGRKKVKVVESDGNTGKKAVGIGGLLMTGAMWFIKARFGTPWAAAEYVLSRVQNHRAAAAHRRPQATPRSF